MEIIKSIITKSEHFETIMIKYEQVGATMSVRKFYMDYVSKIDPSIKMRTWQVFMQKFNKKIAMKSQALIEKIADKQVSTTQMEDNSLKKVLAIADFTLDQVVEDPELLAKVPISKRMTWLFSAMKSRDSRMITLTKVNAEKRKTSMYEDMLEGAQYGAVEEGEAVDGQNITTEPELIAEPTEAPNPMPSEGSSSEEKPKSGETIEFSPNQLEHAS